MRKKIWTMIIASLMIIFVTGITAFAAVPEIAYEKDAEGNASEEELEFYLTKPEEAETAVFDNCYYVSAVGEDGIEVYFLIFNNEEDRYFDLEIEKEVPEEDEAEAVEAEETVETEETEEAEDEEPAPCVIGTSGILLQEVNLPYIGLNKLRLVATKGEIFRIVDRDITVLEESVKEEMVKETFLKLGDIIKNIFDNISN